jgi:hypothetical protein
MRMHERTWCLLRDFGLSHSVWTRKDVSQAVRTVTVTFYCMKMKLLKSDYGC